MTDLEQLKAELQRINKWRMDNLDLAGGPIFRRSTLVSAQLTNLIEAGGGSQEDRANVTRELTAIYEGKRDEETAGKEPQGPCPE